MLKISSAIFIIALSVAFNSEQSNSELEYWTSHTFCALDSANNKVPGYLITHFDSTSYETVLNGKFFLRTKREKTSDSTFRHINIESTIPNFNLSVGDTFYTRIISVDTVKGKVVVTGTIKGKKSTYSYLDIKKHQQ